jgi:hypothetical protein
LAGPGDRAGLVRLEGVDVDMAGPAGKRVRWTRIPGPRAPEELPCVTGGAFGIGREIVIAPARRGLRLPLANIKHEPRRSGLVILL